jgi:DNA-binding IscR family transcriptional regulator
MLLIGRNFRRGLDPLNTTEIAVHLRLPAGVVKEFISMFAESKLVQLLADQDTSVLGRDPATISIKEILDCVRNSGKSVQLQANRVEEECVIEDLLCGVDRAATQALDGKTLQSLILALDQRVAGALVASAASVRSTAAK